MPTYARAPVEFVRGEGARLWDSEGKEYLDFFAGLSVHNAGHCHPRIVAAITEQAARFNGSSNLFFSEPALRLAERISESSLGGKVFLCELGRRGGGVRDQARAQACARARRRDAARSSASTAASTAARSGRSRPRPSSPTRAASARLPGASMPSRATIRKRSARPSAQDTAAVMIEPIQGEAGIFPISDEVLIAAREACDETGALLILDEVQTGMGRTGSLWALRAAPGRPDLMTAAKALGGGLPVGAVVTTPRLADTFEPGDHGTTFGGGPVGASAALGGARRDHGRSAPGERRGERGPLMEG